MDNQNFWSVSNTSEDYRDIEDLQNFNKAFEKLSEQQKQMIIEEIERLTNVFSGSLSISFREMVTDLSLYLFDSVIEGSNILRHSDNIPLHIYFILLTIVHNVVSFIFYDRFPKNEKGFWNFQK